MASSNPYQTWQLTRPMGPRSKTSTRNLEGESLNFPTLTVALALRGSLEGNPQGPLSTLKGGQPRTTTGFPYGHYRVYVIHHMTSKMTYILGYPSNEYEV